MASESSSNPGMPSRFPTIHSTTCIYSTVHHSHIRINQEEIRTDKFQPIPPRKLHRIPMSPLLLFRSVLRCVERDREGRVGEWFLEEEESWCFYQSSSQIACCQYQRLMSTSETYCICECQSLGAGQADDKASSQPSSS